MTHVALILSSTKLHYNWKSISWIVWVFCEKIGLHRSKIVFIVERVDQMSQPRTAFVFSLHLFV